MWQNRHFWDKRPERTGWFLDTGVYVKPDWVNLLSLGVIRKLGRPLVRLSYASSLMRRGDFEVREELFLNDFHQSFLFLFLKGLAVGARG